MDDYGSIHVFMRWILWMNDLHCNDIQWMDIYTYMYVVTYAYVFMDVYSWHDGCIVKWTYMKCIRWTCMNNHIMDNEHVSLTKKKKEINMYA